MILIWDKVFKNGQSKICGRQPFKYLRGYGLPGIASSKLTIEAIEQGVIGKGG